MMRMADHAPDLLVLTNVRPWGGAPSDIVIEGDRIRSVETTGASPTPPDAIDGGGLVALPGLVNAHAHVDKSSWGRPWESYGGEGGTQGRIAHERSRRDALGIPSIETSVRVLRESLRTGTTRMRTHVDVDPGVGLRGIDAVREAAASLDGAIELSIVAFPQDGVLRRPGVLELLEQAAAQGAEHIGGLDPMLIDHDPVGQLDGLFSIVAEHGCGLDLHLHEPGELGASEFDLILDRVERDGVGPGRVNIAHGFAMVEVDPARRRDLLQRMAGLGVTMTTVAPLRMAQLPLHEFDDAGVRFGFGTDGIRDLWGRTATATCSVSPGSTGGPGEWCAMRTSPVSWRSPRATGRRSSPRRRTTSRPAPGRTSFSSTPRTRWTRSSVGCPARSSSRAGVCSAPRSSNSIPGSDRPRSPARQWCPRRRVRRRPSSGRRCGGGRTRCRTSVCWRRW